MRIWTVRSRLRLLSSMRPSRPKADDDRTAGGIRAGGAHDGVLDRRPVDDLAEIIARLVAGQLDGERGLDDLLAIEREGFVGGEPLARLDRYLVEVRQSVVADPEAGQRDAMIAAIADKEHRPDVLQVADDLGIARRGKWGAKRI